MFGSLSGQELLVISSISLFMGVFSLIPACLICRKAGYTAWLGVVAIIPVLAILLAYFLAFAAWPIELQLKTLHSDSNEPAGD